MSIEVNPDNITKVCDKGKNPFMLAKGHIDNEVAKSLAVVWVNELGNNDNITVNIRGKLKSALGGALVIYRDNQLDNKKDPKVTSRDIDDSVKIMSFVSRDIARVHSNNKMILGYYDEAKEKIGIDFVRNGADLAKQKKLNAMFNR